MKIKVDLIRFSVLACVCVFSSFRFLFWFWWWNIFPFSCTETNSLHIWLVDKRKLSELSFSLFFCWNHASNWCRWMKKQKAYGNCKCVIYIFAWIQITICKLITSSHEYIANYSLCLVFFHAAFPTNQFTLSIYRLFLLCRTETESANRSSNRKENCW